MTSIAFENVTATIEADRLTIQQNFQNQTVALLGLLLWVAGGGFAFLTLVGNLPFAIFWACFMLGIRWFIKRYADDSFDAEIDKAQGKVTLTDKKGGHTSVETYDLSAFTLVRVQWAREPGDASESTTDLVYKRYLLSLYRPMENFEIDAELPQPLAAALNTSPLGAKLARATARKAGLQHIGLLRAPVRSESQSRRLAAAIANHLAPEFSVGVEDYFNPSAMGQM